VIEYVWQERDDSKSTDSWTPRLQSLVLHVRESFLCLVDGGMNSECGQRPVRDGISNENNHDERA
jgi:hypothetical protein